MSTPLPTSETWLLIPLYNESAVIGEVIREARQTFPNIVCVNDGSTDGSGEAAEAAGAIVINHPINLGQGAALQTGLDFFKFHTDGKYCVTFDADGQHRVADALEMVRIADHDNLDIVFGSRFRAEKVEANWLKTIVLRATAWASRRSTGIKLTDTHNGLRLISRRAAEIVELRHNRMAHATEIVTQLARSGLPWAEIPVYIRYTDYSRSKGQSMLNSINIVVELLFS
ncbi:glycosyltransferase family 2 protein [Buchananella hordeovulneris]|uniref:glycosyltransferase family 2 protein n=1 Tax=Buchananella hordeovulneris TaxID=52770 RepID=UPI0026DD6183|nr:glycosyltransferase family 2 protein [Buchananella hordeovulneris]MDO5079773.1 glycosyltransferase family 2 protein [Buchananella hordeovulneris]